MELDDTAVLIRVCRECKPAEYRLPDAIKHEFTTQRDEMSAAILRRAEPVDGWDDFNERPFRYPAAMKNSKLEGSVEIRGVIGIDGSTINLEVSSSTDARLTDAAVEYARQLRWLPARLRSTPVQVPLHVTVEFSIYGE
jgi:TonB family protein